MAVKPVAVRSPGRRWIRWCLALLLMLVLVWQWGTALAIELKAQLAQVLIERAWEQTLASPGARVAPWPWADTAPLGRLQWLDTEGRIERDLYVLSGAHGSALAFGPGLAAGMGQGENVARVIGGHRDTHFEFLNRLKIGDRLRWQSDSGDWEHFRVSQLRIADSRSEPLVLDPQGHTLWLVTCYPFDSLRAGGPLRYVVRAEFVEPEGMLRLGQLEVDGKRH